MVIPQGKHRGETTEMVFFKDPYYVKLLFEFSNPDGLMPEIREEFGNLEELFREKEFECKCSKCGQLAETVIVYNRTLFHEPCCMECGSKLFKEREPKVDVACDFHYSLEFVDKYWRGDSEYYRMMIRNIAVLKGLPELFSQEDVMRFFAKCEKECDERN